MHVVVNGRRTETAAADLPTLLRELEYEGEHMAIAVNSRVVPRARWGETALSAGDEIEVLTPRQGG
ncbi:MAG TPA: sulfur carrier protein ThiS [Xanthobacteraceae bacterium]|nr:sulfur carrier protein ThiS [Xanthobacteraceae bacterium]